MFVYLQTCWLLHQCVSGVAVQPRKALSVVCRYDIIPIFTANSIVFEIISLLNWLCSKSAWICYKTSHALVTCSSWMVLPLVTSSCRSMDKCTTCLHISIRSWAARRNIPAEFVRWWWRLYFIQQYQSIINITLVESIYRARAKNVVYDFEAACNSWVHTQIYSNICM